MCAREAGSGLCTRLRGGCRKSCCWPSSWGMGESQPGTGLRYHLALSLRTPGSPGQPSTLPHFPVGKVRGAPLLSQEPRLHEPRRIPPTAEGMREWMVVKMRSQARLMAHASRVSLDQLADMSDPRDARLNTGGDCGAYPHRGHPVRSRLRTSRMCLAHSRLTTVTYRIALPDVPPTCQRPPCSLT